MDFTFTPEQLQLADSVRRFVDKDYDFETRGRIVRSPEGTSAAAWSGLVDLGLTALPMPEAHGGFDGTAVDLLPVMQELGRGLVSEPYFATIFGAEFVKRAAAERNAELLEGVATGSIRMAVAFGEAQARHDPFVVATTATPAAGGHRLDGTKRYVPFGAQADRLVVSARIGDREDDLAVFVIDATLDGIRRADARTLDGQRVADVVLDGVVAPEGSMLAEGRAARELIDAVTDYGVALLCAEAVGVMEALNAATLEYAKTRKQFGQPIARFQVLQHRMVDMFIHLEQARSMAYLAAVRASSTDANERTRVVSAAKVRVGQAARYIGQQAVQIHGGMGVTDELPAAHLFKRLTMLEMALGDTDHHLQRFIAASAAAQPSVADATSDAGAGVEPLQRAA